MIKISIVIPSYNVEKYIGECLDSVLSQTLNEIEVICFNDYSSDDTGKIIEKYALQDKRIRYIRNEHNIGYQSSRNIGIELAKGKYIYFLDSDDSLIKKNALELIYYQMERRELDAICFGCQTVDELDKFKNTGFDGEKKAVYPDVMSGEEAFWKMKSYNEYRSPVWMYMYKTSFLREVGIKFIPNSCSEDMPFTFHVHMTANRMAVLCENLYKYRLRDNSQVHSEKRVYKTKSIERNICYLFGLIDDKILYNRQFERMYVDELKNELSMWKSKFEECSFEEKKEYIESIESEFIKSLFVSVVLDGINYLLPPKIISQLKNNKIFLYGAGNYARRYLKLLDEEGLHVEDLLITKKRDNESLFGYQPKEYASCDVEGAIIIPAVSEKYKDEVIKIIESKSKIIVLDLEQFKVI